MRKTTSSIIKKIAKLTIVTQTKFINWEPIIKKIARKENLDIFEARGLKVEIEYQISRLERLLKTGCSQQENHHERKDKMG